MDSLALVPNDVVRKKMDSEVYDRLVARYESGQVPWDDALPPPEVIDFLSDKPPGRALDLGCGYGRASIYLAQLGWEVDGVDFIAQAIEVATERAKAADVNPIFHLADITNLDFLNGPYDFALDVGCGHNLKDEALISYRDQLKRLLRLGATFMLFARLADTSSMVDDVGPNGIDKSTLLEVFLDGFELRWIEEGQTEVDDQNPWRSAWFRFSRG